MENLILYNENNVSELEEYLSRANKVIYDSSSPNSKIAMQSDLRYWQAWLEINKFDFTSGVTKEHIVAFIIQHAEEMPNEIDEQLISKKVKSKRGLHKISTIDRKIASLSTFLNLHRLPNLCYDPDILFLLKRLRSRNGTSEPWGKAITLDILNDLLLTCKSTIIDIRDKAIMLFGFSTGGRRRSEIANAEMKYLTKNSDGNYLYNLKMSKTNQEGKDEIKPLFGRAAMSLTHWLDVSGITSGNIFRKIHKTGSIYGTNLSDEAISDIIKKRCELAGYNPDEYTAHSLRSGFVTEGGKRGKPLGDIMNLTGHKNVKQVMHYYQAGNVANNSMAYLAG